MLNRLLIFLIAPVLTCSFSPGQADPGQKVLAVQSMRISPYEEAFNGFKKVLNTHVSVQRAFLSGLPPKDVKRVMDNASPDLVLAIGMEALYQVKNFNNFPIVYVMVLDSASTFSVQNHITGVNMTVDPGKQLSMLAEALPRTRAIGILYDPEKTGLIVKQIRKAAQQMGISVVARQVFRAKNVPPSMIEMRQNADVFWMLPDLTVVTPETVEFLFLMSMESNIPILTFSEKYVEQGALLSIGVDPLDMGRQAAAMAEKILAGAAVDSVPTENARKAILSINKKIADKLEIKFDDNISNHARFIE